MFDNFFFSPEDRAVYEIMWKTTVEPSKPQMKIWRISIACWILNPYRTNVENRVSS